MKPFKKLEEQVGKKLIAVDKECTSAHNASVLLIFDDSYSYLESEQHYGGSILVEEELTPCSFYKEDRKQAIEYDICSQEQFDKIDKEEREKSLGNEKRRVLEAKRYYEENKHKL